MRAAIVAAVVVVFIAIGGYLVFGGHGGGGAAVTLSATVGGAKMTPAHLSARGGDTITLTIAADRAEEIHLHGYDLAFNPVPGKPDTKTFKADRTGMFPIEIEATSTPLGDLTVT